MPVTRKPPVGVNKKMAQKGDQFGDYYQDEEEDRVYGDTSARSSPGGRRKNYHDDEEEDSSQRARSSSVGTKSYHDKEEERTQDVSQRARSSSVGRRRSCQEEVEENQRDFGERSNHESGDDDWILVDPKTDREFMDTIRRRILQCVSTNTEDDDQEDDQEDQKAGEIMQRNSIEEEEEEEDWEEREKRELRASLSRSSLNVMEDKGWDVKEELRMIPRNDDDEESHQEDDAFEEGEKEREVDNYPSRELITNFMQGCSLFQEDEHRQELMSIVKSYIRKVKKETIMDIIDTILSDNEENAEDAIFLISEVLYGK